jgi:hypothetical protein
MATGFPHTADPRLGLPVACPGGNVPVETIAVQMLPPGASRRIDAGVPANKIER